jgi:erythronate-4-phosphate dehydrogenase
MVVSMPFRVSNGMKFVIDDNIPYIKGVFEPFGDVLYRSGSSISPEDVNDATALIVRTRTRCDASLLEHASVTCIATATIGYDHIDTDFCDKKGIFWANAPGCNAASVEQYVASALCTLSQQKGFSLQGKTLGVVGVGHVGSTIAKLAERLGMRVLLNDPPRSRKEGAQGFCSLSTVLRESDIVSLHVPLLYKGMDATFHMVDEAFIQQLSRTPILINTCRGEVMHTQTVYEARKKGLLSGLVIDCWENEPNIDVKLLNVADIATPHIAGYSRDGKANATTMVVRFISKTLQLGIDNWQVDSIEEPKTSQIRVDGNNMSDEAIVAEAILGTYDILRDDKALRLHPALFEQLRSAYPVRREFPACTLSLVNVSESIRLQLKQLGFNMTLTGK